MLPTFDVPPVGPKQAKVWGDTQLLFVHNGVECHRIRFKKDAFCSRHRHHYKWNRFVVLEGKLQIDVVVEGGPEDIGLIDSTEIVAGQITDVPPGVFHRFVGVEDGSALEFYWTSLEAGDIERVDRGGVK